MFFALSLMSEHAYVQMSYHQRIIGWDGGGGGREGVRKRSKQVLCEGDCRLSNPSLRCITINNDIMKTSVLLSKFHDVYSQNFIYVTLNILD